MKTNFCNKNFALSLAFIMRFTATRKWPINIISKKYHGTTEFGAKHVSDETSSIISCRYKVPNYQQMEVKLCTFEIVMLSNAIILTRCFGFCFFCFQLFSQFDAEGEGFADVETFLEVLCMSVLLVNYHQKQDLFMFIKKWAK